MVGNEFKSTWGSNNADLVGFAVVAYRSCISLCGMPRKLLRPHAPRPAPTRGREEPRPSPIPPYAIKL